MQRQADAVATPAMTVVKKENGRERTLAESGRVAGLDNVSAVSQHRGWSSAAVPAGVNEIVWSSCRDIAASPGRTTQTLSRR
mmetsp:Transcript_62905/g.130755  ORF Transcript_62905/g.130755 Transcript_62905/m.130755 type:complete len:82 (+) Transcript_62905:112-357(+)